MPKRYIPSSTACSSAVGNFEIPMFNKLNSPPSKTDQGVPQISSPESILSPYSTPERCTPAVLPFSQDQDRIRKVEEEDIVCTGVTFQLPTTKICTCNCKPKVPPPATTTLSDLCIDLTAEDSAVIDLSCDDKKNLQ